MVNWRSVPWIVIDTETTGTDPAVARIVEVAAIVSWQPHPELGDSLAALVDPDGPIPAAATEVHGITDAMVAGAPRFDRVGFDLAAFVEAHPDAIIAGYNAKFDRAMLIAEYLRAGLNPPTWLRAGSHWLDVLVWAREHDPYAKGAGRHKLGNVAQRLGVDLGDAHRALGDCQTATRVLARLAAVEGHMPEDFDDLITWQRVAAAENEARFLKWQAQQPKREKVA